MEHLLTRILSKPSLQQAQLAGNAVRGEMSQDARRAFSGLSSWSAHPNLYVRIASGVGYGLFATMDRDALTEVLPFLERLANDSAPEVRKHGAQSALEQLWLVHSDAMENVAEQWMRTKNDLVREVIVRTIAGIAVGGQIRRPSILRRFIERGVAIFDSGVPDASPQLRRVLADSVNEIGCLAPDLVTPYLREWAHREDVGTLRLAAEISKLPIATLCEGVDFAGASARLRKHQSAFRIRAAKWVRQGVGTVEYPQVMAKDLLVAQADERLPWAHAADPYRGCQLRCEFCNARSLSEWTGDDPEHFVRRVTVLRNAAELLGRELGDDSRLPRDRNVIGIGVLSDPYQPAEEKTEIVREMLKVCLEIGHPVVIQTRQALVLRDLDILEALAEQGLVNVLVAMQTPIEGIRNKVELGTATVAERYRAIGMLARKEVPVGVLLSPIMPDLTDDPSILDETLRRAAESGASWVVAEPLNLRGSAGVKVRLFLDNYIATLASRYDEIYGPSAKGAEASPEWVHNLTEVVIPDLRARYGLDDVSRMLTCGRDPTSLLVRR
ncbi:MAG: radical SAM protein [Planctomycetes bacterium]|nr:radical SAM protein [Planctomycetota bacterium]